MTKLIWGSILSLALISCGQNKSQVDKGKEQIDAICDSVMRTFAEGNFSSAFDILKEHTVISHETIDTLKATTARYAKTLFPTYGQIRSYAFI